MDGRLVSGVAVELFWARRRGDSGRGREGRDLGRKAGLGARPGPTDWLNLEATEGVGGVLVLVPLVLGEMVASGTSVGVAGMEEGESVKDTRLVARLTGRKIPAPGVDVVK